MSIFSDLIHLIPSTPTLSRQQPQSGALSSYSHPPTKPAAITGPTYQATNFNNNTLTYQQKPPLPPSAMMPVAHQHHQQQPQYQQQQQQQYNQVMQLYSGHYATIGPPEPTIKNQPPVQSVTNQQVPALTYQKIPVSVGTSSYNSSTHQRSHDSTDTHKAVSTVQNQQQSHPTQPSTNVSPTII